MYPRRTYTPGPRTAVMGTMAESLAVDISRRIEREMEYPGQI